VKTSLALIIFALISAAAGVCTPAHAAETRVSAAYGEATEQQLPTDQPLQPWLADPAGFAEDQAEKVGFVPREINRVKICRTETVCKLRYKAGLNQRARLKNLVAPLHYDEGSVTVPGDFMQQIRQSLDNLHDRKNLTIRFIAHTDNTPLSERNVGIYGDHLGLSKAVARRIALAVQNGLSLPGIAFESAGEGTTLPIATNATATGRAMNRRVEVEFWHDDPLQSLPDEPQLCPEAADTETVTRVHMPLQGDLEPILFVAGEPVIPAGTIERLQQIINEVSNKDSVRLRFVGYAGDTRLDRRTAAIYGDDIGLSTARARRAMEAVTAAMGLSAQQAEFEGRGFESSSDMISVGTSAPETSRVLVQVVYDEQVSRIDYDGIDITRLTREVNPVDPFGLNLMRISVDGQPLDDPGKSIPDVQRCTDVALDKAQIAFTYDNLKQKPRLNITAWPSSVAWRDREETDFVENRVAFRLYTNYHSFIDRAEVRIFDAQHSERDAPLAIVALDKDGRAQWQPGFSKITAQGYELKYLVRVYDRRGHFDETKTQPLWVIDQTDPALATADPEVELLVGYGETRLASQNIPLTGGTVQVLGSAIPAGHSAWLAGYPLPVDAQGRFAAEEILPEGMHSVEVAVLDAKGNGELFLRDLELKTSDWFTVGIADVTLSANQTDGPAELVAPDQPQYGNDVDLQGRLAFFTKGKLGDGWELKASADTREGPMDEIFSNFLDKSPEALFRRMDTNDPYPTYGDDSTVEEDAPTLGKFYLKLKKNQNHALWGNFKIGYTDNDLAHVDRSLYGANLHLQSQETTSFGEQRFFADGFAAEPGTVAERDEFRGTGGSLYYLQHQDILTGSDQVRIEIRDKDSGMTLGVKNLTPALDYTVDALQGRLLLTQPLSPTADDNLLVQSAGLSGNPVFLVVRYEYTPGLNEPDTLTAGGRMHYWFDDHLKLGVTADRDADAGNENRLAAADLTLRSTAQTWLKLQVGQSEGPGLPEATSADGGYAFVTPAPAATADGKAMAYRIDGSVGLQELFAGGRGHTTFYLQNTEAGYAAPGLLTAKETAKYGGTADLPISDRQHLLLKGDLSIEQEGLKTATAEANLDTTLDEHWMLGSGLRYDKRTDDSAVVPLTQEVGDRTDAVVRLTYDSRKRWSAYGFAQQSLQTTDDREENNRIGAGGSVRLTDRFKALGEVSDGNLGASARLGTEYLYSDRTTLYLNYALENERSDNGLRARKGSLVSGFRNRYSDSVSVYLEERYTHGDVPTGLMHSTGVDLAPNDRLNFGANLDYGTLVDHQTGATLDRTAAGVRTGYGFDQLKITSAVEYRVDDAEQPDTSTTKRTSWLLKNSFKYQMTADGRLIGTFNYSQSDSSQGTFYDGSYTEAVIGYAYRPVNFDRLNALVKYTYFYNLPAVDQVTATGTATSTIQRSHIAAIDVMYDLTSRWTLGGKYAYRQGEVSQDRVNPTFFANRAHLYVLRADWHVLHNWDALLEGRRLDLPDARESRDGVLVALYRHLGEHIKVGAGYNFSNFSDDLTDLSYKHQGLFINLVGKM
jgi:flagellar motor protein MotB